MEKIICSAIWYKDFGKPHHSPINVDKGVVLCGHRHAHIIGQMMMLTSKRTVTFSEDGVGEHEQGFLTSLNRFVDRTEAAEIFIACGGKPEFRELYSEDIY